MYILFILLCTLTPTISSDVVRIVRVPYEVQEYCLIVKEVTRISANHSCQMILNDLYGIADCSSRNLELYTDMNCEQPSTRKMVEYEYVRCKISPPQTEFQYQWICNKSSRLSGIWKCGLFFAYILSI